MNGTVMVFIAPEGRVIASATDFAQHSPGGFTNEEAQRLRCRDALAAAIIDAFASPVLNGAMDSYSRARIVGELEKSGGYRTHTLLVEITLEDVQAKERLL